MFALLCTQPRPCFGEALSVGREYHVIVPSTDPIAHTRFTLGPIRLIYTSPGRQLLGLVLLFIGYSIISWAADPATVARSAIVFTAVGGFVSLNGLYLGGFRPR